MKSHKNIILFSFFLFLFLNLSAQTNSDDYRKNSEKMNTVLQLIKFGYVDSVSLNKYVEKGVVEMLKELDPHTAYISTEEVERTNEPLVGNFEGVGIQFQILKDTIIVASVINGGPSEKVGILAGDKIVKIDTLEAVGKHLVNKWVFDHLRGKKGTTVVIQIMRRGSSEPLTFTIIRDKIPINSIDAYYMVAPEVGYIKLDRFAQTTMDEFRKAIAVLKINGMKHLIFDLRGNGGGYLGTAIDLSDEFLPAEKQIVYTEGSSSPIQRYYATAKGEFENGRLVILIDEGSASASEIVSGAVQDWDRGILIGRRSFGKGLVQKPYTLNDGSVIRLTTARYHTPTGRCIQKPYVDGLDDYYLDFSKRMKHGEFLNADSIKFPDSLKYFTPSKRVVYGGGGIMPDIFIPMDTNKLSSYYTNLFRKGVFNNFVMQYLDANRKQLKEKYPSSVDFIKSYNVEQSLLDELYAFGAKEGVTDSSTFNFSEMMNAFILVSKDTMNKILNSSEAISNPSKSIQFITAFNEYVTKENNRKNDPKLALETLKYIKLQMKFLLARNLYDFSAGLQIWAEVDDAYLKALQVIQDEKLFKKMKINR
ncbi:MAG: S41 family peptidase [Bacteroidota bacterium]